jgi:hypothetical protein
MKPKKIFLIFAALITCIALTSCYRDKIKVNTDRARGQLIPIEKATAYEKRFIASHQEMGKLFIDSPFSKNHFHMPDGETFNRDMIALLLNQDGADSIRIYYGEDEEGHIKLVLLPVDKDGNPIILKDIAASQINIPGISSANAQGGGSAGETGQGCSPCK